MTYISVIILSVIFCMVRCEFDPIRSHFRHKVIPLEEYYPVCEPNTICKWAVCAWNRDPESILSDNNCFFYDNHQCRRCPENYKCASTGDKEVESQFVTFAYRCLPM